MNEDYSLLFEKIKYKPQKKGLFKEAFTHRSSVGEKSKESHNERLEFLGDAVLELVTTEFLFERFPEKPEGDLTNYRSALVCGAHLAEVARKLDLGQYLIMSHGERKSGGANKDYLLANVVEAFIGAMYLQTGMKAAAKFIKSFILVDIDDIVASGAYKDSKSAFQELTQGDMGITPHYQVISESGLDHEKTFVIGAFLGEVQVGEGKGSSKKEGQLAAAANALELQDKWFIPKS